MNSEMFSWQFKYSPYVPFDPTINPLLTGYITHPCLGGVQPYAYTDWRDEEMSWHDNCYLHGGLNPTSTYWFKGTDCMKFLKENFTNKMETLAIGGSRHGIMCNEDGLLMNDGMLIRVGEDEYITYWLLPYIEWAIKKGGYKIEGKNITGEVFLYQLGGPRSLEVVEATTGEDFHDLKFGQHRMTQINGMPVRILRIGMCGSLGYEIHGDFKDCLPVYNALLEAGKPYGITRLGRHAYWNAHTENGYPQAAIHFPYAWETDKDFFKLLMDNGGAYSCGSTSALNGSFSNKLEDRYVNPYELGWGPFVNFDHDFVGKEALMKIRDSAHREMVTLEWNADDIIDIYRSEFEAGEPYAPIEGPEDTVVNGIFEYRHDQVLVGKKCVGYSSGRIFSWYYRKMLSLCVIEAEFAKIGTEIKILWGDPGTRQKEIRAKVERFPYMDINRNEKVDVNTIPSGLKK